MSFKNGVPVECLTGFTIATSEEQVLMDRTQEGFEEIMRDFRGSLATQRMKMTVSDCIDTSRSSGIETAKVFPRAAQPFGLNADFASGIPQKSNEVKTNSEADCSEYYTIPSIERVASTVSVPSFVVGRKDYGSISFKKPVNLTGISSMTDLCKVVVIEMGRVSVYPTISMSPNLEKD